MAEDNFNQKQREAIDAIDEAVRRRADAVKLQVELSQEIASLCVDARAQGVVMRVLADHVQIYDKERGEMRSVTRQSVDGMIAELEERRPRPPRTNNKPKSPSPINHSVFGIG